MSGCAEEPTVRDVFISLGRQLSTAAAPRDAALATLHAAQDLLGWDAAFVDYCQRTGDGTDVQALVVIDTINGQKCEVEPWRYQMYSGTLVSQVLTSGPRLILRQASDLVNAGNPFGDQKRLSASLMFVPISAARRNIGMLSVQSYTPQAYTEEDLDLLVALAEFCGGSLSRTTAQEERDQALDDLARERDLLHGVLNAIPDHIYVKDRESRFLINNTAHLEFLGAASQADALGKTDAEFFPPEMAEKFLADERHVLQTGQPLLNREELTLDREGRRHWVSTSKVPWRDGHGAIIGTVGLSRNITDWKLAEEELFRSNAQLQAVLDASEDYIFVIGADMRLLSANSVASRRYGLSVAERIGKTFHELIPNAPDLADFYQNQVQAVFGTGQPRSYEDSGVVSGRRIFTETLLSPIFDQDGHVEAVLGVSREITGHKELEEELRSLSLVDDLTGLTNRRGFQALAEQQLRSARRSGSEMLLIFADLDGLKRINDTFGHQEGDQALIAAAQVLRATFRESDIIARLGGDEFTVLAVCDSPTSAEGVGQRVRENVAAWNASHAYVWDLSLSLGTARILPGEETLLEELMSRADEALYYDKRARRRE